MVVAGEVVIEIKSLDALLPVHKAQLMTYLKPGGWKAELLINFNVPILKQGIQRVVPDLPQ